MDSYEIYQHLNQIIEQVNSIVAELISKDYFAQTTAKENEEGEVSTNDANAEDDLLE
jgi:hypothetical protein